MPLSKDVAACRKASMLAGCDRRRRAAIISTAGTKSGDAKCTHQTTQFHRCSTASDCRCVHASAHARQPSTRAGIFGFFAGFLQCAAYRTQKKPAKGLCAARWLVSAGGLSRPAAPASASFVGSSVTISPHPPRPASPSQGQRWLPWLRELAPPGLLVRRSSLLIVESRREASRPHC